MIRKISLQAVYTLIVVVVTLGLIQGERPTGISAKVEAGEMSVKPVNAEPAQGPGLPAMDSRTLLGADPPTVSYVRHDGAAHILTFRTNVHLPRLGSGVAANPGITGAFYRIKNLQIIHTPTNTRTSVAAGPFALDFRQCDLSRSRDGSHPSCTMTVRVPGPRFNITIGRDADLQYTQEMGGNLAVTLTNFFTARLARFQVN
jgi:hypothetical protein